MVRCLVLALCLIAGVADAAAPEPPLAGELLVAAPDLADPNFSRTVVVMVEHDASGAMGLVINRTGETMRLDALLDRLGVEREQAAGDRDIVVHAGGPVGLDYGFVLHEERYADRSTARIGHGVAMSVGVDVLRAIAEGDGPERFLFAVGFAGWGPGQLEAEIAAGIWVVAPVSPALVFDAAGRRDADEDTWRRALASRYLDL